MFLCVAASTLKSFLHSDRNLLIFSLIQAVTLCHALQLLF